MTNIQEIAQKLVVELETEMKKQEGEVAGLRGAVQGVNFLYTRIMEALNPPVEEKAKEDEDSKPKVKKSKAKSKSKK